MSEKAKQALMTIKNPTPLEALKKCECSLGYNGWLKYRRKDINIIEIALNKAEKDERELSDLREFANLVIDYCNDNKIQFFLKNDKDRELLKWVVKTYGRKEN